METKKAKIKQVTGNGTWNNQQGQTYYKWEVTMDNGDIGGTMTAKQEQDKWVVGKEVSYSKEVKGNFTNFKLIEEKKPFNGPPKNEKAIIAQSSIASAVQFYQRIPGTSNEDVIECAEVFFNWVCKKGGIV